MSTTLVPLPHIPSERERQFAHFNTNHPEVYETLVDLARLVRRQGFRRYSIKSLFEQLRWHYQMEKGDRNFKLNNNWHSLYARLIMDREKDLKGFFETRTLLSA